MSTEKRYGPEFRKRAVRLVDEQVTDGKSQWAAMQSISQKLGCTPETLRRWVRRVERDEGKRPELTTEERDQLKALERDKQHLRKAAHVIPSISSCRLKYRVGLVSLAWYGATKDRLRLPVGCEFLDVASVSL